MARSKDTTNGRAAARNLARLITATTTMPLTWLALAPSPVRAAADEPALYVSGWVGPQGGSWNKRSHWTPLRIPNNTASRVFEVIIQENRNEASSVTLTSTPTINSLTLGEECRLTINDGKYLRLVGDGVTNDGTILLNAAAGSDSSSSPTNLRFFGAGDPDDNTPQSMSIDGSGTIILANPGARISGNSSTWLTNSDNTIRGAGYIGDCGFQNDGTIISYGSHTTLTLHPAWRAGQIAQDGDPLGFVNAGVLRVEALAELRVDGPSGSFLNLDEDFDLSGTYEVVGRFSFRDAEKLKSLSGELTLDGPLSKVTDLSGNDALQHLTKIHESGTLNVLDRQTLRPTRDLTNLGNIFLGSRTTLRVDSADVANEGLLNGDIVGGTIQVTAGTLSVSNGHNLWGGDIILGDTDEDGDPIAGRLYLDNGRIGNDVTGLEIDGALKVNEFSLVRVTGTDNSIDQSTTIDEEAELHVDSDSTLAFRKRYQDAIRNDGTISLGKHATLNFEMPAGINSGPSFDLVGNGTITMNDSEIGGNALRSHFTNGNTIEGSGAIGTGKLRVTNESDGLMHATKPDVPLVINAQNNGFTNRGELRVKSGATMIVNNGSASFASLTGGGTYLTDGTYTVGGTMKIEGCDLQKNGASIELRGESSRLLDFANNDALRHFHGQDRFGWFCASSGRSFTIDCATVGDFTNLGDLVARGGGTLVIQNGTLRQQVTGVQGLGAITAEAGGTVRVLGQAMVSGDLDAEAGGTIEISNSRIDKTSLYTEPGGTIRILPGGEVFTTGELQNEGRTEVTPGAVFSLSASGVSNDGRVVITGDSAGTAQLLIKDSVELAGGGVVEMHANAYIAGHPLGGSNTLFNSLAIRGSGTIDLPRLFFQNDGSVIAGDAGASLRIATAGRAVYNNSQLASDGGTLWLDRGTFVNGGVIEAIHGVVLADNTTIDGGTVQTRAGAEVQLYNASILDAVTINQTGGQIRAVAGTTNRLGGSLDNATGATVRIDEGATLELQPNGDWRNAGEIVIASGASARLRINGDAALYGGGTVRLGGANAQIVSTLPPERLTNIDNTIRGGGAIGAGAISFLNQGRVVADHADALVIDTGARPLKNAGTFRVERGSQLLAPGSSDSFTNFSRPTATISGGTYDVAGTFKFTDAYITTNRANLILDGWDPLESTCRHASLSIL